MKMKLITIRKKTQSKNQKEKRTRSCMFRGKEPELGKVAEKFEKVFCTSKGYKNNEIIYSV